MTTGQRPYRIHPIKIGCEVFGIDLKENITDDVVQLIKEDVKNHRILVFRDQDIVPPSRHLEIARWFGDIESTYVILVISYCQFHVEFNSIPDIHVLI